MAINKYVYVTVNNLSSYFPHRLRISYSQTELTQDVSAIRHPIVREALKTMDIHGGIDINVMADIPAGTGMGSSSAFTVSLLHALHSFRNTLVSKEALARQASELEIEKLGEPIGKQDQYASAFGGLNLFRFMANEQVAVDPLPLSATAESRLMERLLLFYLGGERKASGILQEQKSNLESGSRSVEALHQLREQALRSAKVIAGAQTGSDLDELGDIMKEGWVLKKTLASGVSTSIVDEAVCACEKAGARGARLLGAGGTGFLLVYAAPEHHQNIRKTMDHFKEIRFQTDHMGSTLLYYGNE
jgi:D-glycero-alpha-D-manno-heptose-7-phosphate kinase